ncbi:10 kDa heat shock protein, partial [Trypanosoma conorhini]
QQKPTLSPMFRATFSALRKLQPLGPRVLVKRTLAAKQTKAGVLIPEQVAGKVNEGTVVAVAAATKDWAPTVKVNDTVLLPEFGGSSVKVEGEEFFLYNEDSLLGVLQG